MSDVIRVPLGDARPDAPVTVNFMVDCPCGVTESVHGMDPGGAPWTCPNRKCRRGVRVLSAVVDGETVVVELEEIPVADTPTEVPKAADPMRAAIEELLTDHVLADGEDYCRDCGESYGGANWPCGVVHTIREHLTLRPAEGSRVDWRSGVPSAFALDVT